MSSDVVLVGELVDGSGELAQTGLEPDALDLVAQWLIARAGAPGDLAPPTEGQNTYRRYRTVIGRWLTHCVVFGVDPIRPGRAAYDEWRNLVAVTPTLRGKPPSTATMANTESVLASFFGFLLEEEETESTPIRRHNRTKAPKESQTVGLSAAEVDAFEATLLEHASPLERAILLTLLWQGLRATEMLTMTVGAIGWNAGVRTMRVHGKGGKIRTIPVAPDAGEAIDTLLAFRFGEEDPPADALVFTLTAARLTRQAVTRVLQRLARAAGIPSHAKLSLHSMRHTCATMMLDSGAPLHVVQDFLGHSSPETTGRYDRARGALDRAVNAQAGMRRHVSATTPSRSPNVPHDH